MTRKVWFQLVDEETGNAFAGTSADAVDLPATANSVRHLRDAVKEKLNDSHLKGTAASDLRVYANKEAYVAKQREEEDSPIGTRGDSKKNALIVEVPEPTESFIIEERKENEPELMYYQQRGRLIQDQCPDYCVQILDKVDALYNESNCPLPFICVEGSSGMGKSQLAFALGGRRPYFYWLATPVTDESQSLYRNSKSISIAFREFVNKDNPTALREADILNSLSNVYEIDTLWTYDFICALLEHCSSEEQQNARQMIRFDKVTPFNVKKCDLETVRGVISRMKKDGKVLPFFILDELTLDENADFGGNNMASFQRNVFRACGLVVTVMGTDSKITNLLEPVAGSYIVDIKWMSLVPRFPSYQTMLSTDEERRVWSKLVSKYPVVQDIVTCSRGRFARYFMERVVECMAQTSEMSLCSLLDDAFAHVSRRTHDGETFLNSPKGKYAQLMAMSFTNAAVGRQSDKAEPPRKKARLEVATFGMRLHFANLVDDELKDMVAGTSLNTEAEPWRPQCYFPAIHEDVLLYLAILGGQAFPSYYDYTDGKHFST